MTGLRQNCIILKVMKKKTTIKNEINISRHLRKLYKENTTLVSKKKVSPFFY